MRAHCTPTCGARPGQCVDSGLGGFGVGYQGGDAGGSGAGVAHGSGGKSLTTGTCKLQEDGVRAGHGQVKISLL